MLATVKGNEWQWNKRGIFLALTALDIRRGRCWVKVLENSNCFLPHLDGVNIFAMWKMHCSFNYEALYISYGMRVLQVERTTYEVLCLWDLRTMVGIGAEKCFGCGLKRIERFEDIYKLSAVATRETHLIVLGDYRWRRWCLAIFESTDS